MLNFQTVTNGDWSVSCTTGAGIDGAILRVFKLRAHGKMQKGNADGLHFASSDLAFKYAYTHGYTKRYYSGPACLKCRTVHTFMGHRSGFCPVHTEFC